MKTAHRLLPIFGMFCCMCGAFASLPVIPKPPDFQLNTSTDRTAADERLSEVERGLYSMNGYGDRLTRLEMNSEHHTEQLDQILWMGRWAGVALLAAVFDKFLGVIGLGSIGDRVKKRLEKSGGGGE